MKAIKINIEKIDYSSEVIKSSIAARIILRKLEKTNQAIELLIKK